MKNEKLIDEIKLLDDPSTLNAQYFLSQAFPNSKIEKKKEIVGNIKNAQETTKKLKIKVLSKFELVQEIKNFDLVFVSSKYYKGSYNKSYLESLNAFLEEHPTLFTSNHEIRNHLHVLYPINNFLIAFKYTTGSFFSNFYNAIMNVYDASFIKNPTIIMEYNNLYYVIEKGSSYGLLDRIFGFLYNTNIILMIFSNIFLASLLFIIFNFFIKLINIDTINAISYIISGITIIVLCIFQIIARLDIQKCNKEIPLK